MKAHYPAMHRIIYIPETGAGHHDPDTEAPKVVMTGRNSKLDFAGRFIHLPFHGTEGHKTLSNWYTTLVNAYGSPIEHYADLDLEMSRRNTHQTGPIEQFIAWESGSYCRRDGEIPTSASVATVEEIQSGQT